MLSYFKSLFCLVNYVAVTKHKSIV